MVKAPKSYLNKKRPLFSEAIALEGKATSEEALASLEKKGYFTPPPKPWSVGVKDRGLGRSSFAVLDRFGDVVVETKDQVTAEFIASAVKVYKP